MDLNLMASPSRGEFPILKTVLIIDDDLGFVFWLGHGLDAAAYTALPARTVPDAALLIMQLDLTVDVLLINLSLAGSIEFIAALHRSQRDVRVIGILDDESQLPAHITGVNATHTKPTVFDDISKNEWLVCIERILLNNGVHRF